MKYMVVLIAVFLSTTLLFSQQVPKNIILGLNSGQADIISKHFKTSVDLIIDNKENIYSSQQAHIILKDFFKKNTPEKFIILHESSRGASKYAIGNLKTSQGQYRIRILLNQVKDKTYIKKLRIEKFNNSLP